MKPLLAVLAGALAVTCAPAVIHGPSAAASADAPWVTDLVARARHVTPAPAYARWWQELVVACDCTPVVSFEAVVWYVMPGGPFPCGAGPTCDGLTTPKAQIVLASSERDRERVVKHEMVHAVLGGDGEHRHPLWRSLCVPGTC